MSRNDWEGGTLILPSASLAALKKTLRDTANAYHTAILTECLRLWNGPLTRTTSAKLYEERLGLALRNWRGNAMVGEAVSMIMYDIIGGEQSNRRKGVAPLRPRATKPADVERWAPRATVRSVTFGEGSEWGIQIEDSKLHYHSGEGKRQVEEARAHPVVAAMFRALSKVVWTRGSGGVLVGNDENNRESDSAGGGGNYITAAFGPRGEAERAFAMGMTLARYRALMAKVPPVRR
jgi:hypothetical protein